MKVRKFSLTNANNTTWALTDPSFLSFGANPEGLGFAAESSYMRVGNDNLLTYSQYTMVEKSFDILFYGASREAEYKMYNDFIKFLVYEPIYLLYETPNSDTTYRMKVKVASLGKTEISPENSALVCPISLTPLSFWEDNLENTIVVSNDVGTDGKHYVLNRPYYYASSDTSNIPIPCRGTLDSPLQITITGSSTNPQYTLYDETDTAYGTGKFTGAFDSVYVNSEEADESIVLVRNGSPLSNPYNYQDLTVGSPDTIQVTFLKLRALTDSKMSLNLSSGFSGTVSITWRNRYLSV